MGLKPTRGGRLVRLAPLAALVGVVVAAVLTRVTRKNTLSARAFAAATSAASESSASGAAAFDPKDGDAGIAPVSIGPLGLGAPPSGASVSANAPRMQHGDRRRTHRLRGRFPARVDMRWKRSVGGAVQGQVTTSPDGQTLYAASLGGKLHALARSNGEPKWSYDLGDRAYATPAVGDDGTIFVGSDKKRFVAVSPEGKLVWKLDVDGEADTAPLVTPDKNVYFAAGSTLYGVTARGEVTFRFRAKKKIFTAPAQLSDGSIVFGAQDDRAYCVSPRGEAVWSVDLGADVDGAPAVDDVDAIFFGTDSGEVVKLSARGQVLWRTKVGGYVRGPLSVARNGDALAGVYGPLSRAVRLAGASGAVVGSFAVQGTGAKEFGVHGGAAEDDDGNLAFGSHDDAVTILDGVGARGLRTRFVTSADVDSPVTLLDDGDLVFGSDDGHVYSLRSLDR